MTDARLHEAQPGLPWRKVSDGLMLTVRVTPRGGRDALDGVDMLADGRSVLKLRVRAAPSDGEANTSVIACLAKALGMPKSAVTITAGATARIKLLHVSGDGAALAGKLTATLAVPGNPR